MKKKQTFGLLLLKRINKQYIIMSTESSNSYVTKKNRYIVVMTPTCFINQEKEQDVISFQLSKNTAMFFLYNYY